MRQFEKPLITAYAKNDPVTAGGEIPLIKFVPEAKGQKHTKIDGGHFVQDDNPAELSAIVLQFMKENPILS